MAIDGPGIIDSDLAHDVYNDILDLYDSGLSTESIIQKLSEFEDSLIDDLEVEIFLSASAKALWEIGLLDEDWHARLSHLVNSGKSLALWETASDEPTARKRKTILNRFLNQIATPRSKPRARKKYAKVKKKLFEIGDCLRFQFGGVSYFGVVCDILEYRGQCDYAMLVMSPRTTSSLESFVEGYYYGRQIPSSLNEQGYELGPHVIRPEHRMLVKADNPFEVIGRVSLDRSKFTLGSYGGVLELSDVEEDFVRTQKSSTAFGLELFPLRELLKERQP